MQETNRYITISLAAKRTGLTVGAIRKRIQRGQWIENREWRHDPLGRINIDTKGIDAWVEMGSKSALVP